MSEARARVGVLISGRGSNMQALHRASVAGAPYEIAAVIANRPDAAGLAWAADQGLATGVVDHKQFGKDRAAFEAALTSRLRAAEIAWVALAGFMRVLTPHFIGAWRGRLINIHPSLLPLFPGLDTHARAIASGVAVHGCTVHHVVEAVDAGAIIGQAVTPVLASDTPETLAGRVLEAEHALYPACLAAAITGAAPIGDASARLVSVLRP